MSKFTSEKYQILDTEIKNLVRLKFTSTEIAKKLNVSKSTIWRRCKKLNISIPNYHNSLKFDNTVFDKINTEEKAYWLGFLYADGYVSKNSNIVSLSLKGSDISHLEKFKNFLQTSSSISLKTIKDYSVCSLQVCNKHFKERLCELGCVTKKSLILTFPNLSIFENESLVYDFIRGYVDGDGCLTYSKNNRLCLYIIGTFEFLSEIRNIFPDKFKNIHKIKRLKSNVWKISNCGKNADFVTNKLYKHATVYLDRKYKRFAVLNRNI